MSSSPSARRAVNATWALPLVASAFALSGCIASPTYGTDKTSSEQLVEDVSNIASIRPKRGPAIDYKPRPELVKPTSTRDLTLPPPQERLASAENPDWPESPEQRRQRIRQEADENAGNPAYRSPIVNDVEPDPVDVRERPASERGGIVFGGTPEGVETTIGQRKHRAEIQRRLRENQQGDPTKRKYLSEPPLEYRQAAGTAPTDDVGEDEAIKERRAKKAAGVKGDGVKKWIPWL